MRRRDEWTQQMRLHMFRARHPEVIIGDGGFGTLQAIIRRPAGETVITRYAARDLCDELDRHFASPDTG